MVDFLTTYYFPFRPQLIKYPCQDKVQDDRRTLMYDLSGFKLYFTKC